MWFSQMVRWARCTVRLLSSGERTRAVMVLLASSWMSTTGTSVLEKKRGIASERVVTTGVPLAVISKTRRAHMEGESTTELTLRKTL